MNSIVRRTPLPALPSVALHKFHPAILQQFPTLRAFPHIPLPYLDQRLDVFNAHNATAGLDEVREHVREVARAGADVKDACAWAEVREEGLSGRGMHMRGADGGGVTERLWGVLIRRYGSVVGSIDLEIIRLGCWVHSFGMSIDIYFLHGLSHAERGDQAVLEEVFDERIIRSARRMPGHVCAVPHAMRE